MDLLKLESPETVTVHIEHPEMGKLYQDDDRNHPITVTVYGPGSRVAVEYDRQHQRKMARLMAKKGTKALYNLPPEDLEEMSLDRLCAMTASVDGVEFDGEYITPETVRRVYANPKLGWLRNQVAAKVASWEEYLGE